MAWLLALLCLAPARAVVLRGVGSKSQGVAEGGNQTKKAVTVPGYYQNHTVGRGIWKWSNALDVYQQFLAPYVGKKVSLAEVGVQSGGSIEMWKAALGPACHVYGLDINPASEKFKDATTTITIGDQGDKSMWAKFFADVTPTLDVLIDDGGHQPEQMQATLYAAFPHINPGGFVAIEDIHGEHYTKSFYWYAANWIHFWHEQGKAESVHLYPFMFVVKTKKPGTDVSPPASAATVSDFTSLWAALPAHLGRTVALQNPAWGSFLSQPSLYSIFEYFTSLNAYSMHDAPTGCARTTAVKCIAYIANSHAQAAITAVDIYPSQLVVHVAAEPPVIKADRKGTVWLPYAGAAA